MYLFDTYEYICRVAFHKLSFASKKNSCPIPGGLDPVILSSHEVFFFKRIILQALKATASNPHYPSNPLSVPHSFKVKYQDNIALATIELSMEIEPCKSDPTFSQGAVHVQVSATHAPFSSSKYRNTTVELMEETKNTLFQNGIFCKAREVSNKCHADSSMNPCQYLDTHNLKHKSKMSFSDNSETLSYSENDFTTLIIDALEKSRAQVCPEIPSKSKKRGRQYTKLRDLAVDSKPDSNPGKEKKTQKKTRFTTNDNQKDEDNRDEDEEEYFNAVQDLTFFENPCENTTESEKEQEIEYDGHELDYNHLNSSLINVHEVFNSGLIDNSYTLSISSGMIVPPEGATFKFSLLTKPTGSPSEACSKCQLCAQAAKELENGPENIKHSKCVTVSIDVVPDIEDQPPNPLPSKSLNEYYYDKKLQKFSVFSDGLDSDQFHEVPGFFELSIPFSKQHFKTRSHITSCAQNFSVESTRMDPIFKKFDWLDKFQKNYNKVTKMTPQSIVFIDFPRNPNKLRVPCNTPKISASPSVRTDMLLQITSNILKQYEKSNPAHDGDDLRSQYKIYSKPGSHEKKLLLNIADKLNLTGENFDKMICHLVKKKKCPISDARQLVADLYSYSAEKIAAECLHRRLTRQAHETTNAESNHLANLESTPNVTFTFDTTEINSQNVEPQTMDEVTRYLWLSDGHPDALDDGEWGPRHIWNKIHCHQRLRVLRELDNGLWRLRVEGRVTEERPIRIFNVQPLKLRLFYDSLATQTITIGGKVSVCRGHLCAELIILRHQARVVSSQEKYYWRRWKYSITKKTRPRRKTRLAKNRHKLMKSTRIPFQWLPANFPQSEECLYHGPLQYVKPITIPHLKESSPLRHNCISYDDL